MKNKQKMIIIIIGIVIILISGLTYAFFSANLVGGNSTTNTIVTLTATYGDIIVTYDNSNGIISEDNIDLKESEKGIDKKYFLKFNIESTANINQDITIKWKDLTNTFCEYQLNGNCTNNETDNYVGDEISYNLYSCNLDDYNNATTENVNINCTDIGNNSMPKTTLTKVTTNDYLTLLPNSKTYYVLLITLQNKETEQNYNQGKSFTGQIDVQRYVAPIYSINEMISTIYIPESDAVASTYVSSSSGIDFGMISSPTNGQGLYINNKNGGSGDIKYFRGGTYCWLNNAAITSSTTCTTAGGTWVNYHCSLDDSKDTCETGGGTFYELKNNIMFGSYAWKIIRINADGSIRMIYNGTSPLSRGTNAHIGLSNFNSAIEDNAYVGYMYGVAGSTSYLATHANTNNSAIKTTIDTWYQNNLITYEDKIVDAGFCVDRSIDVGLGYANNLTYYKSYNRIYKNKKPAFNCTQTNDLYTLNTNTIGNKALTYPVGTINIDEIAYAGGLYNANNYTFYLNNSSTYWILGAVAYNDPYPYVWYINQNGYIGNTYPFIEWSVRPVINISGDLKVTGNGTLNNPWIVS